VELRASPVSIVRMELSRGAEAPLLHRITCGIGPVTVEARSASGLLCSKTGTVLRTAYSCPTDDTAPSDRAVGQCHFPMPLRPGSPGRIAPSDIEVRSVPTEWEKRRVTLPGSAGGDVSRWRDRARPGALTPVVEGRVEGGGQRRGVRNAGGFTRSTLSRRLSALASR
jgi:hypothetical protein